MLLIFQLRQAENSGLVKAVIFLHVGGYVLCGKEGPHLLYSKLFEVHVEIQMYEFAVGSLCNSNLMSKDKMPLIHFCVVFNKIYKKQVR